MHYTLHTYEPVDGNGRAYFDYEFVFRIGMQANTRFTVVLGPSAVFLWDMKVQVGS